MDRRWVRSGAHDERPELSLRGSGRGRRLRGGVAQLRLVRDGHEHRQHPRQRYTAPLKVPSLSRGTAAAAALLLLLAAGFALRRRA